MGLIAGRELEVVGGPGWSIQGTGCKWVVAGPVVLAGRIRLRIVAVAGLVEVGVQEWKPWKGLQVGVRLAVWEAGR